MATPTHASGELTCFEDSHILSVRWVSYGDYVCSRCQFAFSSEDRFLPCLLYANNPRGMGEGRTCIRSNLPNRAALRFREVVVHGLFGSMAMLVAAFQFSNRLRERYLPVHRALGYVYVASVFISCPFAVLISAKLARSPSQFVANCMNSFGWVVTALIALYCIRSGNIVQHRRWMIRSYPWAMTFTFNRATHVFLPSTRAGHPGFEATLWLSSALAAFLPSLFLDWRAIFPRTTARAATVGR